MLNSWWTPLLTVPMPCVGVWSWEDHAWFGVWEVVLIVSSFIHNPQLLRCCTTLLTSLSCAPPPDRLTRSPIHKAKGESYRITALSALCLPSSWDSISLHQCYQESSMSHGSVNSSHKFQEQVQALSSKHQSRVGRQGSKVWSLSPPTLSNARSSKENFTEWFL